MLIFLLLKSDVVRFLAKHAHDLGDLGEKTATELRFVTVSEYVHMLLVIVLLSYLCHYSANLFFLSLQQNDVVCVKTTETAADAFRTMHDKQVICYWGGYKHKIFYSTTNELF